MVDLSGVFQARFLSHLPDGGSKLNSDQPGMDMVKSSGTRRKVYETNGSSGMYTEQLGHMNRYRYQGVGGSFLRFLGEIERERLYTIERGCTLY